MMTLDLTTIAQLLFPNERQLDFARIVAELETVLSRLRGEAVQITWDCDDLVYFDMPETRILLGWSDLAAPQLDGCLTVSVGPGPQSALRTLDSEHDILCSRLVERIQNRFVPLAVIWRQVEGMIDAELVDDLIDTLPDLSSVLPPVESIVEAVLKTDRSKARQSNRPPEVFHPHPVATPATVAPVPVQTDGEKSVAASPQNGHPLTLKLRNTKQHNATPPPPQPTPATIPDTQQAKPQPVAANDQPDLPLPRDAELARLRLALYPPAPAQAATQPDASPQYSTQMRLAAHCLNATLILVWSPLGAAVMTYSLLKGEDMRLSSRTMAVAGTLFALAHTPFGQTVAAMAGVV